MPGVVRSCPTAPTGADGTGQEAHVPWEQGVQSRSTQKAFGRAEDAELQQRRQRDRKYLFQQSFKQIVPNIAIIECKAERCFSFAGLLLNAAFQLPLFSRCFDW